MSITSITSITSLYLVASTGVFFWTATFGWAGRPRRDSFNSALKAASQSASENTRRPSVTSSPAGHFPIFDRRRNVASLIAHLAAIVFQLNHRPMPPSMSGTVNTHAVAVKRDVLVDQ